MYCTKAIELGKKWIRKHPWTLRIEYLYVETSMSSMWKNKWKDESNGTPKTVKAEVDPPKGNAFYDTET